MRAVVFRKAGGAEVLEIDDVETPAPQAGELLVRNFAAALNRADVLQRRGLYPAPADASPILGLEFAGEVAAVGESVTGFQRSDRVFGLVPGGAYAEFLTVPADLAMPIPDTFSYEAAAAVPEAFMVADDALFALGGLRAGDAVLVHAAGSGVGSAALQLAKSAGLRVFATTGSDAKIERCRELGADVVVNYHQEDFAERVELATEGEGVDAVIDLVGAKHFEANLRSLRPTGSLVVVGLVGGRRVDLDLSLLLARRLVLRGTVMRGRPFAERAAVTSRFREKLLPRLEAGELRPVIDRVFMIEQVREAHEHMEANRNVGKIVLRF